MMMYSRVADWLPSRFTMLMGLQAESYQQIVRLFAPQSLRPGYYLSAVGDGLDVRLHLYARHAHTLELELTYMVRDPTTDRRSPEVQIRVYNDARMAEALHCHPGRGRWLHLDPHGPVRVIARYRLHMATFLSRWLEYLAEQGHSMDTLQPCVLTPPAMEPIDSGALPIKKPVQYGLF